MKGLFLVFHGFSAHSGISKKIFAQCEALRNGGNEVALCHTEIAPDGTQRRLAGDEVIADYGRGTLAKITKRLSLQSVVRYVREHGVEFVYIRYDFNASPVTVRLLRGLKRLGVRVALEIPTYPYDNEFAHAPRLMKLQMRFEHYYRTRMARWVDRIVTFSDDELIFGRPTIRISNGIDFGSVPVKTAMNDTSHEVRLFALANIHFWHGFDRVIEGLRAYYAVPHERIVRLRIAGDGNRSVIEGYRRSAAEYGLEEYVEIVGTRSGAELDAEFAWCDLGVGSLGRHRNGIDRIKTLKNREYAARGIPFVYSETDSDFETQPYIFKAPADDSPLDIEALLRFYDSMPLTPAAIRASIEGTLSWNNQMQQVLTQLFDA